MKPASQADARPASSPSDAPRNQRAATALIAEDEPLLAASLRRLLLDAWPTLRVVAEASDGESAVVRALDALPDVLFLDIKMPGRSGLDVAATVVDEWADGRPVPLIVFITAYDEFALAAFDRDAIDYVLKPVTPDRLARTVERLQARLVARVPMPAEGDLAALLRTIETLARTVGPQPDRLAEDDDQRRLETIQVGHGNTIAFVPVGEVLFFEATDKYVAVHTREREGLIRMSMRELLARLDPAAFMQVHRGVVVNRSQIEAATRDDLGRVVLTLRDSDRAIQVSRAFGHRFRAM